MMRSDRRKVLEMLAEGSITPDDAECVLDALGRGSAGTAERTTATDRSTRKYLRVVVEAVEEGHGKATNVNVRVPLQLLRAGIRLTSFMPPEARQEVDRALRDHGIPFDLERLKPEQLEELVDALSDTVVDIDAPGEQAKVKVFCE